MVEISISFSNEPISHNLSEKRFTCLCEAYKSSATRAQLGYFLPAFVAEDSISFVLCPTVPTEEAILDLHLHVRFFLWDVHSISLPS